MEEWEWTCLLLCGFGLLKELRPSEPFVTEYIVDFKNVTTDQVIHDIFPISTYTILGMLIIVFLVTDFVRYRPIIIFQGSAYVLTWICLIWGESILSLQIVQVFYGIAISTDVAYYTYIYAKVNREQYKEVTSYTRTASLTGKFLSGTLSQILTSLNLMNFHQLNYITLSSLTTALFISILLPKVQKSIYFYPPKGEHYIRNNNKNTFLKSGPIPATAPLAPSEVCQHVHGLVIGFSQKVKKAYPILWSDFKKAYRNGYVLKWSIWWAIATAGMLQAQNYIQALWKVVEQSNEDAGSTKYNGAVNAIQCLLSAIFSFAVGHIDVSWIKWGEIFLCFISLLQGFLCCWLSVTDSVATAYTCYVTFRILYQVVITIANAEVAQGISRDSCGLIFGMNTFLALLIQSLLTLVVSDTRGLALDERSQFIVYGSYFSLLGVTFLIAAIISCIKFKVSGKRPKYGIPIDVDLVEAQSLHKMVPIVTLTSSSTDSSL